MKDAALYVHVPFCRIRCPYCDFATAPYREASASRYVDAVLGEAKFLSPYSDGASFTSLFFGGGTPSSLTEPDFTRLVEGLGESFRIAADAEVTLEANPEDITPSKIETWRRLGVNRVSVGVQSFSSSDLERLGRVHGSEVAEEAAALIGSAFPNWSLDLMFGFPGHTMESWEGSLARATELGPPHNSVYQFTAERGTPMGDSVHAGSLHAADDDGMTQFFERARDMLLSTGLRHYEISNYARPGHEARHSLAYWQRRNHLGLGPSAVSLWGPLRWKNYRDASRYAQSVLSGSVWVEEEESLIGKETLEAIMLGLRLEDGIEWESLPGTVETLESWQRASLQLESEGWLKPTRTGIRIPEEFRRLTDSIVLKFWQLADPENRLDHK